MLLGYGVDLTIAELSRRLAAHGHDVTVFATTFDETYAGQGFTIEKVAIGGGEWNRAFPIFEWNAQKTLHRMRKRLAEFDVLVAATFPFYGVWKHFEGPTVFFDFGNVPTLGFSFKGKLNWQYLHLRETYQHAPKSAAVITISRFLAHRFRQKEQKKLRVIHLGGDHYWNDFERRGADAIGVRREARARYGIGKDEVAIISCLRLHKRHPPYKELRELLRLHKELRERKLPVRLVLAGLGSPDDEAWLREEGATPLTNLPPAEMPDFYLAGDIYATASRWEGLNLPLIESAWFALPSVAYAVAAHPETTASRLVRSHEEFRKSLAELVQNPALRQEMGSESRRRAQAFSWEQAYEDFARVLKSVI